MAGGVAAGATWADLCSGRRCEECCLSAELAFAVGSYTPPKQNKTEDTLLAQWNGTRWTRVPTPSPGTPNGIDNNELQGLAASSPSNAWAAGWYVLGHPYTGLTYQTLMLHWNGTSWTRS
jgi:hypothetical protein